MSNSIKNVQTLSTEEYSGFLLKFCRQGNKLLINVSKLSSEEDHYVSDFLSEFNDVDDLLSMQLLNEVISTERSCVYIEKEKTYFIDEHDLDLGKERASKNEKMFLSTAIFKEIVEKWLRFLQDYKA